MATAATNKPPSLDQLYNSVRGAKLDEIKSVTSELVKRTKQIGFLLSHPDQINSQFEEKALPKLNRDLVKCGENIIINTRRIATIGTCLKAVDSYELTLDFDTESDLENIEKELCLSEASNVFVSYNEAASGYIDSINEIEIYFSLNDL